MHQKLYNPFVACETISTEDDESFKVCASYSATSPSPAAFPNGTTVYLGGYNNYFNIYNSSAEGMMEGDAGFPVEANTNIKVLVARSDDDSCTVTVTTPAAAGPTDTVCNSCTYCGNDEHLYSADCTNVENGRTVECESAGIVFFPLKQAALLASSGGDIPREPAQAGGDPVSRKEQSKVKAPPVL
jgi:hypothetical protein